MHITLCDGRLECPWVRYDAGLWILGMKRSYEAVPYALWLLSDRLWLQVECIQSSWHYQSNCSPWEWQFWGLRLSFCTDTAEVMPALQTGKPCFRLVWSCHHLCCHSYSVQVQLYQDWSSQSQGIADFDRPRQLIFIVMLLRGYLRAIWHLDTLYTPLHAIHTFPPTHLTFQSFSLSLPRSLDDPLTCSPVPIDPLTFLPSKSRNGWKCKSLKPLPT